LRTASRVALVILCGAEPHTRTGASPRDPQPVVGKVRDGSYVLGTVDSGDGSYVLPRQRGICGRTVADGGGTAGGSILSGTAGRGRLSCVTTRLRTQGFDAGMSGENELIECSAGIATYGPRHHRLRIASTCGSRQVSGDVLACVADVPGRYHKL